jgi:hypothetical protein
MLLSIARTDTLRQEGFGTEAGLNVVQDRSHDVSENVDAGQQLLRPFSSVGTRLLSVYRGSEHISTWVCFSGAVHFFQTDGPRLRLVKAAPSSPSMTYGGTIAGA